MSYQYEQFISDLLKIKDRATLAKLRHVFIRGQESHAFPTLGRLGVLNDEVLTAITGFYAIHQNHKKVGNFGRSLASLDASSVEVHLQRLLNLNQTKAIRYMIPLVQHLDQKKIAIDYYQLLLDLKSWGTNTKMRWASQFWLKGTDEINKTDETDEKS